MSNSLKKKILFVARKAPYGSSYAKECLDAVLTASAYEQEISFLFLNDGVWQLTKNQNTTNATTKNIAKLTSALPIYDVNNIFVQQSALEQRGLELTDLTVTAKVLSNSEIKNLYQQQQCILSF